MGAPKLFIIIVIMAVVSAAGYFAYSLGGAPKIDTASFFTEEKTALPQRLPPPPKRVKPNAPACENGSVQNGFCDIK